MRKPPAVTGNFNEIHQIEMTKKILDSKSLLNKQITNIFIELCQPDCIDNLSGSDLEVILVIANEEQVEAVRFIADNDVVEIRRNEFYPDQIIYYSIEEAFNDVSDDEIFYLIDLTKSTEFREFVGVSIAKIEIEKYLDGELVGFMITLNNNSKFEVFPNASVTSGHFYDLPKYFPKLIKFTAGETTLT